MTGAGPLTDNNRVALNKLLTQKMASMDSVAAQFAAIQSILPSKYYQNAFKLLKSLKELNANKGIKLLKAPRN